MIGGKGKHCVNIYKPQHKEIKDTYRVILKNINSSITIFVLKAMHDTKQNKMCDRILKVFPGDFVSHSISTTHYQKKKKHLKWKIFGKLNKTEKKNIKQYLRRKKKKKPRTLSNLQYCILMWFNECSISMYISKILKYDVTPSNKN